MQTLYLIHIALRYQFLQAKLLGASSRAKKPLRDSFRLIVTKGAERQLPPSRFTIKSVDTWFWELNHEDAAGIADGISVVR
ncbi:hypothetical protein SBA5_110095 [Candidatus Sulfotelmatomonas gaucii]|uniref:Uncharacterized protein n=1 Tax=Candidatus Sulfuritelmatomonas gaucii TaxID=2043161 RepID=A0A2N9L445_9BACT|nr:hypothetical protein SBA5_110095 [Candidatus Sulfotelmatomonas gaucii]